MPAKQSQPGAHDRPICIEASVVLVSTLLLKNTSIKQIHLYIKQMYCKKKSCKTTITGREGNYLLHKKFAHLRRAC